MYLVDVMTEVVCQSVCSVIIRQIAQMLRMKFVVCIILFCVLYGVISILIRKENYTPYILNRKKLRTSVIKSSANLVNMSLRL